MQPQTPNRSIAQPSDSRPLMRRIASRARRLVRSWITPPSDSRIVITSVPKAGTHLLEKTVKLLPGCYPADLYIEQFIPPKVSATSASSDPAAPAVQARAQQVPLKDLADTLNRIKPGHYAVGHLVFSKPLAELFIELGIKVLFILRDPRDIAVSFTQYVSQLPSHYLFEYYRSLSESERLMTTIVGTADVSPHIPRLLDINVQMNNMLPWMRQPNSYTTTFEKLVGPAGGGTRAAQLAEVHNIARHLNLRCAPHQLEAVADQIFGATPTFRKGAIGGWRQHFTPDHTRAFKTVAGQVLIDLGYEHSFEW